MGGLSTPTSILLQSLMPAFDYHLLCRYASARIAGGSLAAHRWIYDNQGVGGFWTAVLQKTPRHTAALPPSRAPASALEAPEHSEGNGPDRCAWWKHAQIAAVGLCNWRVATELRLTLASRLRNADAEAARALFKDENAPKQVKKLLLSVIGQHHHADVMPCLVDCEVFPWLLNSISGIETLLLELYHPVPSLTHLTALKHIALYGYDGYGALSSKLPLPSLESLELNGRSGRHSDDDMYFDAEFDLQSLQRLQWLGLSYFLPESLTLPSACRVALSTNCGIYNEDYNEEDHTEVWRDKTGQQGLLTEMHG